MNPPKYVVDFTPTSATFAMAMAMAMHDLFSRIERRTTGWAHRGTQGE